MKAGSGKYVAIDYVLKLDSGEEIDRSSDGEPLGFVFGSGQIIPGLEEALEGKEAGATLDVAVEPAKGYGEARPELHREIPRDNFPADLELSPGMGFEARGPQGPVQFKVHEVGDDVVVADFNHPLAGQQLNFDVTVAEVREPTAEELAAASGDCEPEACGSCSGSCG